MKSSLILIAIILANLSIAAFAQTSNAKPAQHEGLDLMLVNERLQETGVASKIFHEMLLRSDRLSGNVRTLIFKTLQATGCENLHFSELKAEEKGIHLLAESSNCKNSITKLTGEAEDSHVSITCDTGSVLVEIKNSSDWTLKNNEISGISTVCMKQNAIQ